MGAAYAANTAAVALAAQRSSRTGRHGSDRAKPATASATTAGTASSAVAVIIVANAAATMITVNPAGATSVPGSRAPAARPSNRPQPRHNSPRMSGKATQHTSNVITLGAGASPPCGPISVQPTGLTLPETPTRRATLGDG